MADKMTATSPCNNTTLQVGEVIRPLVSEKSVREVTRRLYGLEVKSVKELNSYDDRNYFLQVEEHHCNPYIKEIHPHGYVLKILNTMDSKRQEYIDAMQELILYSGNDGIETAMPVKSVSGQLNHLEEIPVPEEFNTGKNADTGSASKGYVVRLFIFVPGIILGQVPYTPAICFQTGKYVGMLDIKLKNFYHKFYDTHSTVWSLESLPKLTEFVYAVTEENDRIMVNEIITKFKEEIIPSYNHFQRGMIHGDCNEQNILVRARNQNRSEGEMYEVCGLIDFGDATYSYLIFEIAISMCYMMVESKVMEPLDTAGHVLAGYLSELPLAEIEMDALKICVAGRFCQTLVMGAYTYSLDPGNDYVLTTAKMGWPCLRQLWSTPNNQLKSQWKNIISTYNN